MDKKAVLAAYWRGHVETWRASGLSQSNYCQQHGLKTHSLSYWQLRQVAHQDKPASKALTLVPATIVAESQASIPHLSLSSPQGWRLEFAALPPADWLTALWRAHP